MTIINIFKEKKLRMKLLFTVMVVAIAELLTNIPVYGVNKDYLKAVFSSTDILGFMDGVSGGSMTTLSMGTFGVTSYITASIIIQLLGVLIPKLEELRRDGEYGRKRFEKAEYILSFIIACASSFTLAVGFGKQGLLVEYTPKYVIAAIAGWIVGAVIIIVLGKKVEDYGIGNGISIILAFNIISRIPKNIHSYIEDTVKGASTKNAAAYIIGLILMLFVFYLITVYLQCGSINVPIKQARKSASAINSDGIVPVSVNIANVLPVIYAASLVSLPNMVVSLTGIKTNTTADKILSVFVSSNWYYPKHWYHILGLVLYLVLLVSLSLFSSGMTFSADEIADSMKKNGNVMQGVNPGKDTIAYFDRRRKIMAVVNVLFLIIVVTLPDLICSRLGITQFSFLGTSLIIIISMLFDTALRFQGASIHNDKHNEMIA